MRILCVFGRHNYGDPARGEGVEYASFLPALRALGHEVEHFESFARTGHADFAALNRALVERFASFRPDVVLTVLMMAEVWLETVALMRVAGARVINWSTDDSWKYRQFSRLIAADFDRFATTWPEAPDWYAADDIATGVLTQWGVAASALRAPKSAAQCGIDVCFIGSNYGDRAVRVERLRRAGIDVRCFGHGWPEGPVVAERMAEVFRDSRLCLNFSEGGGGAGRQIKARVFEVPGVGGALLTEATPFLERYLIPGREAAVFENDDELIGLARRLLDHPDERDAMARAGHARVAAEHTYEKRMAALLDFGGGAPPAAQPFDREAFEAAVARHRVGVAGRALRWVLATLCSAVWGPARGPRAARRLLFEASWRLAGRSTYTAAGLPGRLFYQES
ncbi:MAG: glycosyltransferase [Burkholderiales bacterium]|nr:glycosyltransferase [Burkholderiales bacterium]